MNNPFSFFPNTPKNDIEKSSFFLFNLSLAGFFLLLNIFVHNPGGIEEREEFAIFLHGWLSVPPLTLIAAFIIQGLRKRFFLPLKHFYVTLAAVNGLFWLAFLAVLRIVMKVFGGSELFWKIAGFGIGFFVVLNILTIIFMKVSENIIEGRNFEEQFWVGYLSFMLALLNFSMFEFYKFHFLLIAAVLALLALAHNRLMKFPTMPRGRRIFSLAVIFFIGFFVFDPGFSSERHHQNFWLGPVADLMNGKAPLVNIESEYGVLNFYFLRGLFFFVPFSYQGLNFLVTLLYFAFYAGLYFMLRYLFKSAGLSAFLLFFIIGINFFATIDQAAAYPSVGPLRFGLPYLILWAAILRQEYLSLTRWGLAWEGLILAVASAWSLETFVYSLATYLSINFYDCLTNYSGRKRWQTVSERLLFLCAAFILLHLSVTLDIYGRSGEWPNWSYYFEYIYLFAIEGFRSMLIEPFTPWVFFVLFPLASLLAIVYKVIGEGSKGLPKEFLIISGLTGLAVAQFTYFVGRSHQNNLLHISVPTVILAAFWVLWAAANSGKFRRLYLYSGYFFLFFVFVNISQSVQEKLNTKVENLVHFKQNWHKFISPEPSNEEVAEALALVNRYSPSDRRVAIFIEPENTTEFFVLSRRTHVFPFNQPLGVNNLKQARARVLNFQHPLKEGDYIFFSKYLSGVQAQIVSRLQREFKFLPKDVSPHQIIVMQLGPRL